MSSFQRQSLFDLLPQGQVSTGINALDAELDGGFKTSSLYELLAPPASPKLLLLASIVSNYLAEGKKVLWVEISSMVPHNVFKTFDAFNRFEKNFSCLKITALVQLMALFRFDKYKLNEYSFVVVNGFHDLIEYAQVDAEVIHDERIAELTKRKEAIDKQNEERERHGEPKLKSREISRGNSPLLMKNQNLISVINLLSKYCTDNKSTCIVVGNLISKGMHVPVAPRSASSVGLSDGSILSQERPSSREDGAVDKISILSPVSNENFWNQCLAARIVLFKGWLVGPLQKKDEFIKVIHCARVMNNLSNGSPVVRRKLQRAGSFRNKKLIYFKTVQMVVKDIDKTDYEIHQGTVEPAIAHFDKDSDLTKTSVHEIAGKSEIYGDDVHTLVNSTKNNNEKSLDPISESDDSDDSDDSEDSGDETLQRPTMISPEDVLVGVEDQVIVEIMEKDDELESLKRNIECESSTPQKRRRLNDDNDSGVFNDTLGEFVEASDDELELL